VAGKQERRRRLARQRYERRLARQAQRRQRLRAWTKLASGAAVLAVVAGAVTLAVLHLAGAGKASAKALASPSAPATSPASAASEPARHCTYIPTGKAARDVGLPPVTPDWRARYRAVITTNRGPIVIDLLNSKATCTVNSFVFLARKDYFNRTPCHRLTTSGIYVLQCGDPTGTGTGGPGYEFADENLAGARYLAGTVAMANSGPNTNGSQFFLVYRNSPLPPSYSVFGAIVSGLNIIQKVAKAGTDNANGKGDGHPKEKVVIERVTITKT